MDDYHIYCVLLGSNIEPEVNIPKAVELFQDKFKVMAISTAWESQSIGIQSENFINAAILFSSQLDHDALKFGELRYLEDRLGRLRTENKFAPRTIDLDLIASTTRTYDDDIWYLAHVAVPVSELLPCLESPNGENLTHIARKLSQTTYIEERADILQSTLNQDDSLLCNQDSLGTIHSLI